MSSLYEIDSTLLELIEHGFTVDCVDMETGEIDEEKIKQYLINLPIEREKKLEAYGCLIKNMNAEAEAIREEEKALYARRKAKEKTVERLKSAVVASMMVQGERRFETSKILFSLRKSESVDVPDATKLPEQYQNIKTTIDADKTALKAALKAGEIIEGAALVVKENLQIK